MSPAKKNGTSQSSRLDKHIGMRLRQLREQSGKSLDQLAGELGISAQLLSQYEVGQARCPAALLWTASIALGVNVGAFFEGVTDQ